MVQTAENREKLLPQKGSVARPLGERLVFVVAIKAVDQSREWIHFLADLRTPQHFGRQKRRLDGFAAGAGLDTTAVATVSENSTRTDVFWSTRILRAVGATTADDGRGLGPSPPACTAARRRPAQSRTDGDGGIRQSGRRGVTFPFHPSPLWRRPLSPSREFFVYHPFFNRKE